MSTEPDQVGAVDSEDTEAADTTAADRRGRNPLVVTGAVLAIVAVLCAAVFGVLWYQAAHNSSLAYAKMRDQALQAAEQGSINLTTLDYRHEQQGLAKWKDSTTGGLYTQLTQGNLVDTFTKQTQQAKAVSVGKVFDGVITELNAQTGQASALIYMDVKVTVAGKQQADKRLPLQWNLTMTKTGWKLSGLVEQSAPAAPTTSGQ